MSISNDSQHLPVFGVGPVYVAGIFVATFLASAATYIGWLSSGTITPVWLRISFMMLAGACLVAGIIMWCLAVFNSKMVASVENNQLLTTGIYAWVRHPIYSAFFFLNAGLLLAQTNYWLLILPPLYWATLTVLMKRTEERWLTRQYGQQYLDYAKHVNRVIPWPSK